jgi:hypothetical protein
MNFPVFNLSSLGDFHGSLEFPVSQGREYLDSFPLGYLPESSSGYP